MNFDVELFIGRKLDLLSFTLVLPINIDKDL